MNDEVDARLSGMRADEQLQVDQALVELDGTPNRERLGGNSLIAVSLAVADAAARQAGLALYRWIGGLQGTELPCP